MKPPKTASKWHVYLLRCRDGSLYCGITTDINRRVAEHNSGKGAKYIVPARRPANCVWNQRAANRSDASKLERQIKNFSTEAKKTLVKKRLKVIAKVVEKVARVKAPKPIS